MIYYSNIAGLACAILCYCSYSILATEAKMLTVTCDKVSTSTTEISINVKCDKPYHKYVAAWVVSTLANENLQEGRVRIIYLAGGFVPEARWLDMDKGQSTIIYSKSHGQYSIDELLKIFTTCKDYDFSGGVLAYDIPMLIITTEKNNKLYIYAIREPQYINHGGLENSCDHLRRLYDIIINEVFNNRIPKALDGRKHVDYIKSCNFTFDQ